jgi:hypothetical protein
MKQTRKPEGASFIQRATAVLAACALAAGAIAILPAAASGDSGDAESTNKAQVTQKNIQVVAGKPGSNDSTQVAVNDADVDQLSLAESGDATAGDGGTATSGDATAQSTADIRQLNIQIIAGKECSATQVAVNDADVEQVAVAASGDATATDGGTATSGDATATNDASVKQKNQQMYICTGQNSGTEGYQVAVNDADVQQAAVAVSGDAEAGSGETTESGAATASNTTDIEQKNRQLTID